MMASPVKEDAGPDLTQGVTLVNFGDKAMLRGHLGENAVLLARVGNKVLAVGSTARIGRLSAGVSGHRCSR